MTVLTVLTSTLQLKPQNDLINNLKLTSHEKVEFIMAKYI